MKDSRSAAAYSNRARIPGRPCPPSPRPAPRPSHDTLIEGRP